MAYKTTTISQGQSLLDIAIQEYGSPEGAFVIMEDNPGLFPSITTHTVTGSEVLIRPQVPQDLRPAEAQYFLRNDIRINTNANPGGIGFMLIETTFIVS